MKLRFLAVSAAVFLGAGRLPAQSVYPARGDVVSSGGTRTSVPIRAGTLAQPAPAGPLATVPDGSAAPWLPPAASAAPAPGAASLDDGPCGCLDNASPFPYRFYASAEYLLWRIKGGDLPSMASSQAAGVINVGAGGATTMLPVFVQQSAGLPGSDSQGRGDHSGGRFTAGYWFDPDQNFGIEASVFFLQPRSSTFVNSSNNATGSSLFTVNTGLSVLTSQAIPGLGVSVPTSQPVVFLGQSAGSIAATSTTNLYGGEINARSTCVTFGSARLGGLLGFRELSFNEDLTLAGTGTVSLASSMPNLIAVTNAQGTSPVSTFSTFDSIRTRNTFYGGQAGVDLFVPCRWFFFQGRVKGAIGAMHEEATVLGLTTSPSGQFAGGLLSSPGDLGRHTRTKIAFIPEANLKMGVFVTSRLTAFVGYDALYVTDVIRPGDQSRPSSGTTTVTVAGTSNQTSLGQQSFGFAGTHVWAQGFNFGLQFQY